MCGMVEGARGEGRVCSVQGVAARRPGAASRGACITVAARARRATCAMAEIAMDRGAASRWCPAKPDSEHNCRLIPRIHYYIN